MNIPARIDLNSDIGELTSVPLDRYRASEMAVDNRKSSTRGNFGSSRAQNEPGLIRDGLIDGGSDGLIMQLVSSVNISCGVHAGSIELTQRTIENAARAGVAVGAHPGMPGQFGRSDDLIDPEHAFVEITRQLGQFQSIAAACGVVVSHVKPHGALYNQAETNIRIAEAIVHAVQQTIPQAKIFGLAGKQLLSVAAERGLSTVGEFFADRAYEADGNLRSRLKPSAVYDDPEFVARRAAEAVQTGSVIAADGSILKIEFETICVHGDSAHALEILNLLHSTLIASSVRIERPE
jgi:UPF0271 protein